MLVTRHPAYRFHSPFSLIWIMDTKKFVGAATFSLLLISFVFILFFHQKGGDEIYYTSSSKRNVLGINNIFSFGHEVKMNDNNNIANDVVCLPATCEISENSHEYAQDGLQVSKIAFSSCYVPELTIRGFTWTHVRNVFQPDLWLWLGDNAYSDGVDMGFRRRRYNKSRDQGYYVDNMLAEPKIPVMGIWDDHDYGVNNGGKEYQCRKESQDEFVYHFNLPSDDPRHPDQGENQQEGVYSSRMFNTPDSTGDEGGENNGIQVILLDVRYHRSPTLPDIGECEYTNSTILGETQWQWFENELLNKTSEIKIIGSGISVLLPMDSEDSYERFCSYDGSGGEFESSLEDMEEVDGAQGIVDPEQEGWFQMPHERARLLRLAQKAINDGITKRVIFVSGNQHYDEINAKRMSNHTEYGDSQVLYEVVASRIEGYDGLGDHCNSNRLKVRSADTKGNGFYEKECKFPFKYNGKEYNSCTSNGSKDGEWCGTKNFWPMNYGFPFFWGYCKPEEEDISMTENIEMTTTALTSCSGNSFHVCGGGGFYGGIEVNWEDRTITMSAFTPLGVFPTAATAKISF